MQYSNLIVWPVMAVLTCCVVLATRKHNKPAMGVAIGLVIYCVLLATRDYDQLVFRFAICVLIYLGLLKLSPDAARVWLCAGGALAGALVLGTTAISLIDMFRDGWNVFGIMLLVTPVFAASGLLVGFWVVYRWTDPHPLNENRRRE
jgi:hypothetical protein